MSEMKAVVPHSEAHDYDLHEKVFNMVIEYVDSLQLSSPLAQIVKNEVCCCFWLELLTYVSCCSGRDVYQWPYQQVA